MPHKLNDDIIKDMFLFWRLLLAHILGDFPLQTDTIYYLKTKTRLGSFIHGGIFIILNLLLGWPYLGNKAILIFLISIGLAHAIIDRKKIAYQNRYPLGETIITFLSDQVIHIAILAVIIPFKTKIPSPEVLSDSGLAGLYYNDKFIYYSIGFIFVSFGGVILSAALKNTFSKTVISVNFIPYFEKSYGLMERLIIVYLVMTGANIWPVVISAGPRLVPVFKKKIGGAGNFFINYCLGLFIGLILRHIYG